MPNTCRNQQQELSAVSIFAAQQPIGCGQLGCLQDGWSVIDGTNAVVDGTRLGLLAPHGGPAQDPLVNRAEGAAMASTALVPPSARTASLPLVVLLALMT
jgi:hypothetical protein